MASPPDVLAQEKRFTLELENNVQITGRIDQINRLVEGSGASQVEIVDYKTGKPKTATQARNDLQLGIYALAAREDLELEPARLVYYNLQSNECDRGDARRISSCTRREARSRKWRRTFERGSFRRRSGISAGPASTAFCAQRKSRGAGRRKSARLGKLLPLSWRIPVRPALLWWVNLLRLRKQSPKLSLRRCNYSRKNESENQQRDSSLHGGASRGTGRRKRQAATPLQNDAGLQSAAMICVTVRWAGVKSHRLSESPLVAAEYRAALGVRDWPTNNCLEKKKRRGEDVPFANVERDGHRLNRLLHCFMGGERSGETDAGRGSRVALGAGA